MNPKSLISNPDQFALTHLGIGVLINLFSNPISFLLGTLVTKINRKIRVQRPTTRLWQVSDPNTLTVVVARSTETHTGKYIRPATGIGQVRALAIALASLNKGYRGIDIRNIYLSGDHLNHNLENDLLILGGPNTNEIAACFLDKVKYYQPFGFTEGGRCITNRPSSTSSCSETPCYEVTVDYGLVIRARNPFTVNKRTAILLAGCQTFGTMAAARYFTERLSKDINKKVLKSRNISVVVRSEVKDGFPLNPTKVDCYTW